jgi:hypothetical protein
MPFPLSSQIAVSLLILKVSRFFPCAVICSLSMEMTLKVYETYSGVSADPVTSENEQRKSTK